MKAAALLLCLALSGCASVHTAPVLHATPPRIVCWSPGTMTGVRKWQAEFARRYGVTPNVFVSHGDDDGLWTVNEFGDDAPAEPVLRALRDCDRSRPWLVLSCNPGHYKLNLPGVYVADQDVWMTPGPHWREIDGGYVGRAGSVSEFHEAIESK